MLIASSVISFPQGQRNSDFKFPTTPLHGLLELSSFKTPRGSSKHGLRVISPRCTIRQWAATGACMHTCIPTCTHVHTREHMHCIPSDYITCTHSHTTHHMTLHYNYIQCMLVRDRAVPDEQSILLLWQPQQ